MLVFSFFFPLYINFSLSSSFCFVAESDKNAEERKSKQNRSRNYYYYVYNVQNKRYRSRIHLNHSHTVCSRAQTSSFNRKMRARKLFFMCTRMNIEILRCGINMRECVYSQWYNFLSGTSSLGYPWFPNLSENFEKPKKRNQIKKIKENGKIINLYKILWNQFLKLFISPFPKSCALLDTTKNITISKWSNNNTKNTPSTANQ